MTKPALPPPAAGDELVEVEVVEVEIDAMDVREWEQDQRTPQASDANLAALVRESKKSLEPVAEAPPRKMPLVPRGRVTGLVSPQPPRTSETPPASGVPAKRPAPPFETVTPAAPFGWPSALDLKPAVAEPAAPSGWQPDAGPASVAPVAPSGWQPTFDEVEPGVPDPMPFATGGAPVLLPRPSSPEPSVGPYPRAVADPGASSWPDPGSRPGRRERRATVKTRGLLAVTASRRKLLWIGGTAGLVALVAVLVLGGGRKSSAVATSMQVDDHAQGPAASVRDVAPAPVPRASPPEPAAARDTPVASAPSPAKPPRPGASAVRPGRGPAKQLGGKKLVVEYVERASEVPAPSLVAQAAEDPAVGRARRAYLSGNQKLFEGDADRAILSYRQALILYPGYVGGYRGLGLAYAQRGDTPKALEAFRTYVTAVPNAKDIILIRKRIARLQGK